MRVATPILCILVLLILACGAHSAPRAGLFSVLAGRDLWVFEDPTSLVTFSPSAVVSDLLPNDERGSAVTRSKPGGSFVVVGSQTILAQTQAHHPFQVAFTFPRNNVTLYAATYVPTTSVLVAAGINRPRLEAVEIMFFRSEDGGFTWTASSSWPLNPQDFPNFGTISFSASGEFGLCLVGYSMFSTVDGGRSWTNTPGWKNRWPASVAVLDQSLAVATAQAWGWGVVYTSNNTMTTWTLLDEDLDVGTSIVLLDQQTWVVGTTRGQFWRTMDGGKTWACTFDKGPVAWTQMAYNSDWGALLAIGSSRIGSGVTMALSWDMGGKWLLSDSLSKANEVYGVVPGTPSL